jgi:hypothetical protein
MSWIPSVAEERAQALRHLPVVAPAETPWRYYGLLLRVVFFVLGVIAVSALFGFFALGFHSVRGWLTAAIAIAAAEWLIRRHRFFGTGLESALWLCGTFAFIFGLPSSGKVEAILVFAAAAALSGWRMRNSFFGVIAAVLVVAYVAAKWQHSWLLTLAVASVITFTSVAALRRVWLRPSTNRLFVALAVAMPVVGYLTTVVQRLFRSAAHATSSVPIAAILSATAIVILILGVVWRDRALLVSAALSAGLVAVELHDLFDYPTEWKLIGAGVVVIALTTTLTRSLRGATRGFVVTPVRVGAYDEAMQIGGIIAIAPHGSAPATHDGGPHLSDSSGPTDKSFGGAGAGGGF